MIVTFDTVNYRGIPPKSLNSVRPWKNKLFEERKGVLHEFDMNVVNEIKALFELSHSTIKSISTSCSLRNSIKNGYKKLKTGVAGSKILEFKEIGTNGEDISVNTRIHRGKTQKTIIIFGDTQLVINPKGQIEKNPSMKFIRDNSGRGKGELVSYYTQKEINEINPIGQFLALKSELQKYVDYIKIRCSEISAVREQRAENIAGSVSKYLDLIDSVTEEFNYFKTHINKLSEKTLDKDCFKITNKIKTFHSQNSIMFKNATHDGRSLYLIYSKINRKKAMKLFVMDYGNQKIDKSFVIYENKLAKFFPKQVNKKPSHLDHEFHYFTQEEVDKSDLKYYLSLVDERLKDVNDNLDQGIEDRLKRKNNC